MRGGVHPCKCGRAGLTQPSMKLNAIVAMLVCIYSPATEGKGGDEKTLLHGKASYYHGKWVGEKTASGEIYKSEDMTAAHRSLPFGTNVRVFNLRNGRDVTVRINNRGPYIKGRIIDLSIAAARKIGMTSDGVVPVRVEVLRNPGGDNVSKRGGRGE